MPSQVANRRAAKGLLVLLAACLGTWAALVWRDLKDGVQPPAGGTLADHAWGLAWAVALALVLAFAPLPRAHRRALLPIWVIKATVALGAMLVYEAHYNYSLDGPGYFLRAIALTGLPPLEFGPGIANLDALVWALHWIVPDSYAAMKATFAFAGLGGIYLVYLAVETAWPSGGTGRLWFFALVPSMIFWTSILGKDPMIVLGLGAYAFGAARLWRRLPGWPWPLVAGLFLVLLIRPWIAPMAVIPTILLAAMRPLGGNDSQRARRLAVALVLVGTTAVVAIILARHSTFIEASLERIHLLSRSWAEGGSGQTPPALTTVWSVLAFLPWGVFTALFRPLPGDLGTFFGVIASVEDLALLLAIFATVWLGARPSRRERLTQPGVLWLVLFVALWSLLYAFISYQNLGSAFRFRVQALPFLLALVVILSASRPRPVRPTPRPLRVLHVTTAAQPIAGAERVLLNLARRDSRWLVHITTLEPEGDLHAQVRAAGAAASSLAARGPLRDLVGAARLARLVRAWRPDIVHVHLARPALVAAIIKPLLEVPLVQTRHYGDFFQRFGPAWKASLDAWSARRMDAIIAVSKESGRQLVALESVQAARIHVVPNGIEPLVPSGPPVQGPRAQSIVCAATAHPRKGHEVLLAAFARLLPKHPGMQLVLLGGGTDSAQMKAAITRWGVAGHVRTKGFCSRQEAISILSSATVYVQPSIEEGFGVAVLEAMALGIPVVASDVGGMKETVVNGVTGLRVPPQDPARLADAISRLLRDPALRATYGRAGRKRVASNYSVQAMHDAYQDCYHEVVTGEGRL